MVESLPKLAEILATTPLANQQLAEVEILDTGENAFVVEVNSANALESWQILQDLKTSIGRAPVLVAEFETGKHWQQSVKKSQTEIFSRFPYEFQLNNSRQTDQNVSPQAIIARAKTLDLASVLESYSQREEAYSSITKTLIFISCKVNHSPELGVFWYRQELPMPMNYRIGWLG